MWLSVVYLLFLVLLSKSEASDDDAMLGKAEDGTWQDTRPKENGADPLQITHDRQNREEYHGQEMLTHWWGFEGFTPHSSLDDGEEHLDKHVAENNKGKSKQRRKRKRKKYRDMKDDYEALGKAFYKNYNNGFRFRAESPGSVEYVPPGSIPRNTPESIPVNTPGSSERTPGIIPRSTGGGGGGSAPGGDFPPGEGPSTGEDSPPGEGSPPGEDSPPGEGSSTGGDSTTKGGGTGSSDETTEGSDESPEGSDESTKVSAETTGVSDETTGGSVFDETTGDFDERTDGSAEKTPGSGEGSGEISTIGSSMKTTRKRDPIDNIMKKLHKKIKKLYCKLCGMMQEQKDGKTLAMSSTMTTEMPTNKEKKKKYDNY